MSHHTAAEAARRRNAAYWLSLVAALALTWVFQSIALEPVARAVAVQGCLPDLQVARTATLYQNTQVPLCSKRDLQAFARNDQVPIDEPNDILLAPRTALAVAWAPTVIAEPVYDDLRVGFARSFNPRAPPSSQA